MRVIDDEVGDLARDLLVPEPALSYLRSDAFMTRSSLVEIGLPHLFNQVHHLHDMTNYNNRDLLLDIGRRFAQCQAQDEHLLAVLGLANHAEAAAS
jgi:hypothetical protein